MVLKNSARMEVDLDGQVLRQSTDLTYAEQKVALVDVYLA